MALGQFWELICLDTRERDPQMNECEFKELLFDLYTPRRVLSLIMVPEFREHKTDNDDFFLVPRT